MNIDFHYGVVYVVARAAGLSEDDAGTVAHACQYVDDATTPGILIFQGGETYERFASAHSMYDYHNAEDSMNRVVWAPFHFLPGGEGPTLDEKAVCRCNSDVAKDIVRAAIRRKGIDNALHRLGVTLHVYVDTWAHQGFSGIESDYNRISHLRAEDCTPEQWWQRVDDFTKHLENDVVSDALSRFFPLGHGAALHYPDQPWAVWSYVNGKGHEVHRDNLPQFIEAADWACKAVQGFIAGDERFEAFPGLSHAVREALRNLLTFNREDDPDVRLEKLCDALLAGEIADLRGSVPKYIAKGEGSWKHLATGLVAKDDTGARPVHGPTFENSDYRHFHDAVKEHRFVVTQQILPAVGVRIA
jgi:hypothetical protein